MTSTEKDGARSVPKLTPKGAGAPKSFFFPPGVMLSNRSSVHETTEEDLESSKHSDSNRFLEESQIFVPNSENIITYEEYMPSAHDIEPQIHSADIIEIEESEAATDTLHEQVTQTMSAEGDMTELLDELELCKTDCSRFEKQNEELRMEIHNTIADLVELSRQNRVSQGKYKKYKALYMEQNVELQKVFNAAEELIGNEHETDNPRSFKQIVSKLEIIRLRQHRSNIKISKLTTENQSLEREVESLKRRMSQRENSVNRRKSSVGKTNQLRPSASVRQKINRRQQRSQFDKIKNRTENLAGELKAIRQYTSSNFSSPNTTPNQTVIASGQDPRGSRNDLDNIVIESDEELYLTRTNSDHSLSPRGPITQKLAKADVKERPISAHVGHLNFANKTRKIPVKFITKKTNINKSTTQPKGAKQLSRHVSNISTPR